MAIGQHNQSPCALPLRDRGTQRARWAGSLASLAPNPNPKAAQTWLRVSRMGFEPKTHPPNTKKPKKTNKKTKIENSFCVFSRCLRGFGAFSVFIFLRKCVWLRVTETLHSKQFGHPLSFSFSFSSLSLSSLSLLLPHTRTNRYRTNPQTLQVNRVGQLPPHQNETTILK